MSALDACSSVTPSCVSASGLNVVERDADRVVCESGARVERYITLDAKRRLPRVYMLLCLAPIHSLAVVVYDRHSRL
jgi:hypothetical protein